MKKTLVTLLSVTLGVSAFAQGTLNIANNVTGTFRAPIYGPQAGVGNAGQSLSGQTATGLPAGGTVYTGPLLQGSGFTFAVFYGAASVVDPNSLTLLFSTSFRTATANVSPAGLITSANGFVVPNVAPGDQAKLQIRVWDNTGNATFDNAAFRGSSPLFLSNPLGGVGTGGPVLTPDMTGWTSFNIYAVPEPATFALAGLGAAALLIFRRRK
jgi:hypothetical protein